MIEREIFRRSSDDTRGRDRCESRRSKGIPTATTSRTARRSRPSRERDADPVDEKLRPQRLSRGHRPARASPSGWRSAWRPRKKRGEPLPHILFDGPPGPGQDDVRHRPAQRAGRRAEHHQRRGARQEDGRHALPDQRGRGLDPLHRRDPSPAPRGRGIHLPGHGRLPGRRRARRGDVGAHDQPSAQEVHDHRRDDPQRHALRPAPRAVRHARAPRVLRRRRPRQDHHDQRRQAALDASSPRPPGSWPRAAAGRRGSPTPACAGSATTPWPAPTGRSACRSRAMRSTCRRSTPRGSTSKTAATWKR